MIYPKDWDKVICHDWYEDERKIWLCLRNKNAICEIDKNSKEIKILGSFPHNTLGEEDLSLSVTKCGDYIVFCPFKANDIAVLDINTGELEFIDLLQILGKDSRKYAGMEKFYRMVSHKNHIYFFGIKYPAIMSFDLETKKIELFDEWIEKIDKNKCKDAVLFTDGYAKIENEIYLPIGRCNGVLKINLETLEWEYIGIKSINYGILGMTQKANYVWLTEYDTEAQSFFQWDLNSGEIMKIDLPYQDAFYAPVYCNKSLLFFQNYRKKSLQYDLESGIWKDITSILPDIRKSGDKKADGNKINYFANRRKRFYHWDLDKNMVCYDEIRIKDRDFLENSWQDYCEGYKQKLEESVVKEGDLTVRDYIELITLVS